VLLAGALLALPATPASPAAEVELRGQVRLADGGAVPDARVALLRPLTPYALGALLLAGQTLPEAVAEAGTDADGWYRLVAPGPALWRLRVYADGMVPVERLVPVAESRYEPAVELRADAGAAATVLDPRGVPVAGAWVEATVEGSGRSPERGPTRYGFTDQQGRHRLARRRDEALTVTAWHAGLATASREGVQEDVVLRLAPAAGEPIALRVESARGDAVNGALVWGATGMPIARTGESGVAPVPRPAAGPLRVSVLAADGSASTTWLAPDAASSVVRLEAAQELHARVVDEATGRGVAGALVWIDATHSPEPPRSPRSATFAGAAALWTDGEGWVRSDGRLSEGILLRAAASGYRDGLLRLRHEHDATRSELPPIELVRGVVVPGSVRRADGEPVAGVAIAAFSARRWGPAMRIDPPGSGELARSAADGSFSLFLAPGSYRVRAQGEGFAPTERKLALEIRSERIERLDLVVDPGASAWGTILTEDGRPLAGTTVRIAATLGADLLGPPRDYAPVHESVAGEDGVFRFSHLAARAYDLSAHAPGFAVTAVPGIEVSTAEEHEIGTITLVEGAVIEGRVTDGDGAPIAGARVSVRLPAALVPPGIDAVRTGGVLGSRPTGQLWAVAGMDGSFVVDSLPPQQPVDLHVSRVGFLVRSLPGVVPPLDEPLSIVLDVDPAAAVSGQVVDGAREPLSDVRIMAWKGNGVGGREAVATSDEDGAFRFDALPPGRYRLETQSRSHGTGNGPTIDVASGDAIDDVEIVLDARPHAVVEGVVHAAGDPVAGARLQAAGAAPVVSDAAGRFRLEGVVPGERPLVASTPDGRRSMVRVELEVGLNRVDVELPEGVELTGRVVDTYGQPVTGARVRLGSSPWGGGSTTTDEAGSFRLENVEPGVYRLTAEAEEHGAATLDEVQVASAPVDGLDLRLLPMGSISGRVLGVELDELARLRVVAGSASEGVQWRTAVVDYQGRYRIERLAPGAWLVQATLEGDGRRAERRVEVEAGRKAQLDLELEAGLFLSGIVLRDDEPVVAAGIQVLGLDVARQGSARSDYLGRFRVGGLAPGRYRVEVQAGGSPLPHVREIDLLGDEEITVELRPGGLAGIVLADTGAPIEGAQVSIEPHYRSAIGHQPSQAIRTDDAGSFRLREAAPGTYRVTVRKEGCAEAASTVEVPADGESVELRFVLEPTARPRVGERSATPPERCRRAPRRAARSGARRRRAAGPAPETASSRPIGRRVGSACDLRPASRPPPRP
jgi:protocatechuate 3,4-dioxygenase beta subunit